MASQNPEEGKGPDSSSEASLIKTSEHGLGQAAEINREIQSPRTTSSIESVKDPATVTKSAQTQPASSSFEPFSDQTSEDKSSEVLSKKNQLQKSGRRQRSLSDQQVLTDATMTGTPLTMTEFTDLLNPLAFVKWLRQSLSDVF